jgi:RHS repeat-associated protein
VEVKEGETTLGQYRYDPFGRRISKTVNGKITWFLYSEEGLIGEYDESGTPIRQYGWWPGGTWGSNPIYLQSGGKTYFYLNDHLGTPQKVVDISGSVVWSAMYKSFGLAHGDAEIVSNPLRFPGQYFDGETGLHYNHYRNYNPNTGQYVESDPIGLRGGLNTYNYVSGNPIIRYDPFGLDTYGISLNLNAGFGVGGTIGGNLVVDSHGNVAIQAVGGAGGDTPGASITGNAEVTNANSVHDLVGVGAQTGVDAGEFVIVEGGAIYGSGYSGGYAGYGVGVGTPIGASGYVTYTANIVTFNPLEMYRETRGWILGVVNGCD